MVRYFTDRPRWALPLVLSCVFIGTVSDPWFDAAFTVPAVLLAWRSAKWFQTDADTRRALLKGLIITYVSGRLAYFGLELLHMVPGRSFNLASPAAMVHHLVLLIKSVALLLQFYPLPTSLASWVVWWLYAASLVAVLIMGVMAARRLQPLAGRQPSSRILAGFAGLSIGVIAAAFVLTGFAQGMIASRFLTNIFYLSVAVFVAVGAALWPAKSSVTKPLLGMVLAGYVILGTAAVSQAGWRDTADWAGTHQLSKWLIAHDYKNGYGQYFEVNTSLLSIASNEKIIARPLSCNMGYLIPRLSSGDNQFWFATAPLPSHRGSQFVAFDENDAKWQSCAIKDFGKPDQKIRRGTLNIWVYRHDLSQQLILAQSDFRHKWTLMNIARNRAAITRIAHTIGISPSPAQQAYSWLLAVTA
ncbi:hypothetical protein [Acidithiobacillus sp.]